jgi:hypothetical protein
MALIASGKTYLLRAAAVLIEIDRNPYAVRAVIIYGGWTEGEVSE